MKFSYSGGAVEVCLEVGEETEEEEEGEEQVEADEEEEDASVLQVAIPGDGDCFYLAIVEAFLREGVDVVSLFAGRMGCEVQKSFCQQKKGEVLSELRQRTVE